MQISDSEKCLMDVLWQSSPQSAKQIICNLDSNLEWHEKMVKTLLNRLLKKQAVGFEKQGREYLYFSILKQQDYIDGASESFLNRVFNGNVSSLVAAFTKKEKLSAKDIDELKSLLKEIGND
ncbi:MAG: BlaI/MecI/CopY family transcriptional regulator [Flavobacteriales bacterium]|nr:BlaI/MecI/CopY family transcriptional regulator [Flavobacteriales bacterium]